MTKLPSTVCNVSPVYFTKLVSSTPPPPISGLVGLWNVYNYIIKLFCNVITKLVVAVEMYTIAAPPHQSCQVGP